MIFLSSPFDLMERSIALRYPKIDRLLQMNTIVQTAMNGDVVTYLTGNADWVLKMTFDEISRPKAIAMLDFLSFCAGKTVRLEIDDVVWKGQILSTPNDITTVSRGLGGSEHYREANGFTINFRGTKV